MRAFLSFMVLILLAISMEDASARVCPRNKNFPLIEKGMALGEVTTLIGRPDSAESGPEDSKVLFYCLASSFLDTDGSDTREYWVQLMDGKVIGYGERNDAAAMQRAQRQYAAAWASARMVIDTANRTAPGAIYMSTPSVTTQINVQQNTVIQPVVPLQEAAQSTDDQSSPAWKKWKPS